MRKKINGRVYDTCTAMAIGRYTNDRPRNDFDFVDETLYRKKNGEYFMHGMGGARTKYAINDYGFMVGGEKIIPITDADAVAWCDLHGIHIA